MTRLKASVQQRRAVFCRRGAGCSLTLVRTSCATATKLSLQPKNTRLVPASMFLLSCMPSQPEKGVQHELVGIWCSARVYRWLQLRHTADGLPALPCPALPCPALPSLPCPALPCPALRCAALRCAALRLSFFKLEELEKAVERV